MSDKEDVNQEQQQEQVQKEPSEPQVNSRPQSIQDNQPILIQPQNQQYDPKQSFSPQQEPEKGPKNNSNVFSSNYSFLPKQRIVPPPYGTPVGGQIFQNVFSPYRSQQLSAIYKSPLKPPTGIIASPSPYNQRFYYTQSPGSVRQDFAFGQSIPSKQSQQISQVFNRPQQIQSTVQRQPQPFMNGNPNYQKVPIKQQIKNPESASKPKNYDEEPSMMDQMLKKLDNILDKNEKTKLKIKAQEAIKIGGNPQSNQKGITLSPSRQVSPQKMLQRPILTISPTRSTRPYYPQTQAQRVTYSPLKTQMFQPQTLQASQQRLVSQPRQVSQKKVSIQTQRVHVQQPQQRSGSKPQPQPQPQRLQAKPQIQQQVVRNIYQQPPQIFQPQRMGTQYPQRFSQQQQQGIFRTQSAMGFQNYHQMSYPIRIR